MLLRYRAPALHAIPAHIRKPSLTTRLLSFPASEFIIRLRLLLKRFSLLTNSDIPTLIIKVLLFLEALDYVCGYRFND